MILTIDVGSDILTAWKFWMKGKARYTTYSILTVMFTFLPFFVSLFTTCISIIRRNKKELMEQEKKLNNHIHEVSHFYGSVNPFLHCILYVLFFLEELRKFTISNFPKQTHLGVHIDHFIVFLHPLIDPHFTKMFCTGCTSSDHWLKNNDKVWID